VTKNTSRLTSDSQGISGYILRFNCQRWGNTSPDKKQAPDKKSFEHDAKEYTDAIGDVRMNTADVVARDNRTKVEAAVTAVKRSIAENGMSEELRTLYDEFMNMLGSLTAVFC
jgi:hypothetical protein